MEKLSPNPPSSTSVQMTLPGDTHPDSMLNRRFRDCLEELAQGFTEHIERRWSRVSWAGPRNEQHSGFHVEDRLRIYEVELARSDRDEIVAIVSQWANRIGVEITAHVDGVAYIVGPKEKGNPNGYSVCLKGQESPNG